jgi:hypothetical protein
MEPLLVLIFDAAAIFCESIYLAVETFLHALLDLVQQEIVGRTSLVYASFVPKHARQVPGQVLP